MILLLIKKELHRVFTDRRLIVSLFILPCLSIFIIYGLIGTVMNNTIDDSQIIILTENIDEEVPIQEFINPNFTYYRIEFGFNEDNYRAVSVKDGNAQCEIHFNEETKTFNIVYNSNNSKSTYAYQIVVNGLNKYRDYYLEKNNEISNNIYIGEISDLNVGVDESARAMASLLTMLVVSFVFSGAISIGADCIAGEKERQTLTTVLMTPNKTSTIVLGKTFAMMIITIISALSSLIGLLLTIPINGGMFDSSIKLSFQQIGMLAIALLAFTFVVVSIILLFSTIAKTIKEANSYISPFYLLCTVISIMLFANPDFINPFYYYIPVVNNIFIINDCVSGNVDMVNLIITVIISLIVFIYITYIQSRLLENEKTYFTN